MSDINRPIGLWKVIETSTDYGVYEKGWGFVAIHHKSGLPHWEEGQAIRRALIVAAPALLEALQAVVSVADRATVEFDKARAAIAKALGE